MSVITSSELKERNGRQSTFIWNSPWFIFQRWSLDYLIDWGPFKSLTCGFVPYFSLVTIRLKWADKSVLLSLMGLRDQWFFLISTG
jgi:hypothetical protein